MTRILITGFGPFPGAPRNPTMAIVRHLARCRFPRFERTDRVTQVLPTQWSMLPAFREQIMATRPDAVLMFGLAGRRRAVTPEVRAVNHASLLHTDAAGRKPQSRNLGQGNIRFRKSSIDPVRMTALLRQSGLGARVSFDAGDYLCNALLWTALSTGVPAIFVHVPRPRRPARPRKVQKRPRPTQHDLNKAGEIALSFVLKQIGR